MLEITVLGCGSSIGVPVIGCNCKICKSGLDYNKRRRCAIVISSAKNNLLIDFGFDIKDQLLEAGIINLSAAILTHDHADHVAGIDNLKVFYYLQNRKLNIYADSETIESVASRYSYFFKGENNIFNSCPVDFNSLIEINGMNIQFFKQDHGVIDSLGVKIENFAYSCDVINFPQESEKFLYNLDYWIVDCRSYNSNYSHAGLDKVLQWREKFNIRQVFLTNMDHTIDYYEIQKVLPSGILPLHDGFTFKVNKPNLVY